jgi:lipopolysaccharide biosynthesis protein
MMKTSQSHSDQVEALVQELATEVENHRKTMIKLRMREFENRAITESRSYKLARILANTLHLGRVVLGRIKALSPNRLLLTQRNRRHVKKVYASSSFTAAFLSPPGAELAVIIHLYYTDMLPLFVERLSTLKQLSYDLYITVPEAHATTVEDLRKQVPAARIAVVPNCGRDVLPFVKVLEQLNGKGYDKILKLHSKKSPHRSDGSEWRDRILDSLLPKDQRTLQQIFTTLAKKDTAIIGPTDEYVSLLVNFTATLGHFKRIIKDVCGEESLPHILRHPDEYGFFGGTMFWARFDAILPVVEAVQLGDFEPELGQEDSTLAHALERVLNVVPELQSKQLYELHGDRVVSRAYETTNIPAWAEYSIDNS